MLRASAGLRSAIANLVYLFSVKNTKIRRFGHTQNDNLLSITFQNIDKVKRALVEGRLTFENK
jgi:hypothetical protein